ncbi:MAG: hypothetical protein ACRDOU_14970 [Streptosporangiaceae bacterium]
MTQTTIRVVIADDHPVVRDGLSALLASVPSVAAIFNKLQVADRNQAIILARDAGLGRTTRPGSLG